MVEFYKEDFESAKQYSKKLTVFNLNSNTENASSSANQAANNGNQTTSNQQQNEDATSNSNNQNNKQKRIENQKIGLIRCLINVEDWTNSLTLLEKLPQWYLATHEDTSQSICRALHKIIDPIYQKFNTFSSEFKKSYFKNNSFDAKADESLFKTFNEVALPILCSIGPGASCDTILITQLIRICASFIEYVNIFNHTHTNNKKLKPKISLRKYKPATINKD